MLALWWGRCSRCFSGRLVSNNFDACWFSVDVREEFGVWQGQDEVEGLVWQELYCFTLCGIAPACSSVSVELRQGVWLRAVDS